MLDDARKVLAQDRAATQAHHAQMLGATPAGDDGVIHIGDVNYAPSQQQKPGMSTFAKLAAAALAATGVGLPVGVGIALPTIIDALTTPPPVTQPVDPTTIDRDWKLGDPILE